MEALPRVSLWPHWPFTPPLQTMTQRRHLLRLPTDSKSSAIRLLAFLPQVVIAVASAGMLVACRPAAAATPSPDASAVAGADAPPAAPTSAPLGLSGSVGLGALTMPTYEGSDRHRTLAVPLLALNWRTADWGTVSLDTQGLAWQVVDRDGWRASVIGAIDPGRKDRRPSGFDIAPGDKRLAGMGRIGAGVDVGAAFGYGPVQLSMLKALGDGGSRGARVTLGAELPWAVTTKLGVSAAVVGTWADRKYMQSYFGVTAAQSAASGYDAYTPRAGLQKVELDVGADQALTEHLHLKAGVGLSRLESDAARSPLVQRRTGLTAQVGVAYAF